MTKPHFRIVADTPVEVPPRETPLETARRKYGRPFCSQPWAIGEGPRFFTADRVSRLAAANEEHRVRRANRKART